MDYEKFKSLSKLNSNEFEKICHDYLITKKIISINFFGKLYRGRLFDETQSINNVSEISYIPNPEWVKGYGRANKIGQPIFYCAESFNTIFFESMIIRNGQPPTQRERLIFGEWLTKEPLKLVIIIQPDKNIRKGFFETQYGESFDNIASNNSEVLETMKFLYRVYSERAKENIDYILPSTLSNYFYKMFDGILYPSLPFTNGGYNIALKPNVKESKLKINKVIMNTFIWEQINKNTISDNGELIEAKLIDLLTGEVLW